MNNEKTKDIKQDILIRQENLNGSNIEELIELSKIWAMEESCYGMEPNTLSDLKEPLYIARIDGKVVGYLFGHYYTVEKKESYIHLGAKGFWIDELYVLEKYRSLGIGTLLFRLMEVSVNKDIELITLGTSNKNYHKILGFYCEKMHMNFHSALVFKYYNEGK